jgi:hypothetical protein
MPSGVRLGDVEDDTEANFGTTWTSLTKQRPTGEARSWIHRTHVVLTAWMMSISARSPYKPAQPLRERAEGPGLLPNCCLPLICQIGSV